MRKMQLMSLWRWIRSTAGGRGEAPVAVEGPPLLLHAGDQDVVGGEEGYGTPLGGTPPRWLGQLRPELAG